VSGIRIGRRARGASAAVRWFACLLLPLCVACTSTSSVQSGRATPSVHVVQPGETLHKIAWQHRVDQRDLVQWNGLKDPDKLRVGQRLRLVPPPGHTTAAARAPPPQSSTQPRASSSGPQPTPTRSTAPRPTATTPPRVTAPPPSRSATPAAVALAWSWPTDGRVVAAFGASNGISSGVAIGGRTGQPVRAAAAGRVVYAGGGLIGYGQLVIIKHDETFLSAYGYNSDLLVTQGQDVARGATIALMGQGPERQPRLHFEIRRNGVPVDPLSFVTAPR
jgi:lipoprotein NlpD